jgi:hypothetical protein
VSFAAVEATADAVRNAQRTKVAEFFCADSDEQKCSLPMQPNSGYPVTGALAHFGERPSREGVRRRTQSEFFRMLSPLDRAELLDDPACPLKVVTNHNSAKIFVWGPTTAQATATFARFESHVDREHSKFEKRHARNKEAAAQIVLENLATFKRDAERLEAEAAELAAHAARMREQAEAATKIKTRAQLEAAAAGTGKTSTTAKSELAERDRGAELLAAEGVLQNAFLMVDGIRKSLREGVLPVNDALSTLLGGLIKEGQAALAAGDAAKVREIAAAIGEACEVRPKYGPTQMGASSVLL